MTDIVNRLRDPTPRWTDIMDDAANEIERLRHDLTIARLDKDHAKAELAELLRDVRQLQEGHNAAWERYSALASERFSLRQVLRRWQTSGCPDCGGDCSSANPPVQDCIMADTRAALKETGHE